MREKSKTEKFAGSDKGNTLKYRQFINWDKEVSKIWQYEFPQREPIINHLLLSRIIFFVGFRRKN